MDSKSLLGRAARIGIVAGLAGLPALQAAAQTADFTGKRIEVIVPFAPGGGSDVYIRALQPYLEIYLPGNPTILVRNVPGGGSIPGANQFQDRAKPDGLHAIVVSASTVANFVFRKSKVNYQLDKWQPVLLSPQGAVVYAAPSLGIKGPRDLPMLKGKPLVFGGESATSGELRIIVSMELLGLDVKHVWGLRRGPVRLAFERGEMSINYDSAPGYLKNATKLVKAGKAVPLYSFGILDEKGNIVRDPNFKDLPSFPEAYEQVHGKKPSGTAYGAWKALMQMGIMANKALFLPADTPKHIVEAWRTAIRKVLADPDFQKYAAAVVEGYPQFVGEAARPVIKEATDLSPETWNWLKGYLKQKHNVTL
ncbi:MAG: tricarboxylate transporter [Betaproteobacteria bacterium]|nr:tricarboxylate transporter [Betaproteobacteria bacterium]